VYVNDNSASDTNVIFPVISIVTAEFANFFSCILLAQPNFHNRIQSSYNKSDEGYSVLTDMILK
jgi:hypothetical protein